MLSTNVIRNTIINGSVATLIARIIRLAQSLSRLLMISFPISSTSNVKMTMSENKSAVAEFKSEVDVVLTIEFIDTLPVLKSHDTAYDHERKPANKHKGGDERSPRAIIVFDKTGHDQEQHNVAHPMC